MSNKRKLTSIGSVMMLGSLLNIAPVLLGISDSALSQSSGAPQNTLASANLNQVVTQLGYTPVSCSAGVATIKYLESTVCVNPTAELSAGNYTYDPNTNKLIPANSKIPLRLTFTTPGEYMRCVENIIQLYQDKEGFKQQSKRSSCITEVYEAYANTGLSKAEALDLVKDANVYATTALTIKMYPLRGIRLKVAKLFGFIYEVDANDEDMRRAATQGS